MSDFNIKRHFRSLEDSEERECFLVEMDFSQLEVCGLAEISGDPVLRRELNSGVDIHTENAKLWLKRKPTPEERKKAKVMTFQLQYGAGAAKMAQTLHISEDDATAFIKSFYSKYEGIDDFHKSLSAAKRMVENDPSCNFIAFDDPAGRVYKFVKTKTEAGRPYLSLTQMKNYPVQGFSTGAIVPIVVNMIQDDILKTYLGEPEIPLTVINTIHDSLAFECKGSENIRLLFKIVEDSFVRFPSYFNLLFSNELTVDYNYDIKVGKTWSDMEKFSRSEVQSIIQG
jgi:DNA polymerase I-like protein with 3'-5' exonuclease and polymerase domains